MLLRRHKINSVRQGNPDNIVEDVQQEELYGDELNYKAKDDGEQKVTDERPYTKTEIRRMKLADLQELATENEIEGVYEMTGEELKEALISLFEL